MKKYAIRWLSLSAAYLLAATGNPARADIELQTPREAPDGWALANNGAEIIAMPIWGGHPALARARAIENQVYVVSSTYTDHTRNWIKTGIIDHEGRMRAEARAWGEVVMTEVDLNQRTYWPYLGDFKSRIHRERPAE